MITYQDLQKVGENEQDRQTWVYSAIQSHRCAPMYRTADVAQDYFDHKNRTINEFQKLLYTVTGKAVVDNYSANYKMANNYFHRFVVQEVQFLLGNGTTWGSAKTGDKLGDDFDTRLQEVARNALIGGESFGFWNYDHMEVFKITEFVPIYDETNGALMAGIRFWQIDSSKPLRATFYEVEGVTEYMWDDGSPSVLKERTPYVTRYKGTEADGMQIYDFQNYPTLPIVPLWGNLSKQSEIIGLREQIDCYDLIKSGFANDVDDASLIYWTIQNAGGMDDVDLARFVERMKTVRAAAMDDNAKAEAHTMDVPYESREALLDRLERDLYKDAMALDTSNIASGATTATQIKAAYEPLNSKCDDFEYCIRDFLDGILELAEIDDKPSWTRSMIVNATEEMSTVLQAAQYLPEDYVTTKILTILGDGDMADDILKQMEADEMERMEVQAEARTLNDMAQGAEPGDGEQTDGAEGAALNA